MPGNLQKNRRGEKNAGGRVKGSVCRFGSPGRAGNSFILSGTSLQKMQEKQMQKIFLGLAVLW